MTYAPASMSGCSLTDTSFAKQFQASEQRAPLLAWAAATALLLLSGCSPEIGDDCSTSLDCSANGDRICDVTSPGGYCTIQGCEADTCPEGSVCVEFNPDTPRRASTWCMAPCKGNSDCRTDDGYECLRADTFPANGARVLDGSGTAKFCAQPPTSDMDRTPVPVDPTPDSSVVFDGGADQDDASLDADVTMDAATDAAQDASTDAETDAETDAAQDGAMSDSAMPDATMGNATQAVTPEKAQHSKVESLPTNACSV